MSTEPRPGDRSASLLAPPDPIVGDPAAILPPAALASPLPFGQTHARTGDPATSHAAAASALDMAEGHCAVIHTVLTRYAGGQSASQLAARIPHLSRHQILKRLPDLEMQGLAHPTTETRTGATGRQERVWLPGPNPNPAPKRPTLAQRVAELEARLTALEERHG